MKQNKKVSFVKAILKNNNDMWNIYSGITKSPKVLDTIINSALENNLHRMNSTITIAYIAYMTK